MTEVAIPMPVTMLRTYEGAIGQILPAHIEPATFLRVAESVLRKNEKLMQAAVNNPGSFLAACMDAARLGHEPGTDHYALTVRSGAVMGIEQYQGVIERMYRAGAVVAVHAHVVHEHDNFVWNPTQGPPVHDAEWFAPDAKRGEMVGVYAYAQMDTGATSRVVVMGREEIMAHRAMATTKNVWDGPFKKSMWLKTGMHELEKWVPTSSEYRRQVAQSRAEIAATGLPAPIPTVVYPDTDQVPTAALTGAVMDATDWPETAAPPTACPECHQTGTHKMDCSRRGGGDGGKAPRA